MHQLVSLSHNHWRGKTEWGTRSLKEEWFQKNATDWYESTLQELKYLYPNHPNLNYGGVLIIDDYGYWHGCRKAVAEYSANGKPFLCRLDQTGKFGIKADLE